MSRIGRMPIERPRRCGSLHRGGQRCHRQGPQGHPGADSAPEMILEQEGNIIHVKASLRRQGPLRSARHDPRSAAQHGRWRQRGLQEGAGDQRRRLPCRQEGQRAGHEHGLLPSGHRAEIDGITIEVPAQNKVVIHGADKQKVGQFAAEVREKRPPEPYKGKGIKYVDEVIRRKVGKTGAKK